MPSLYCSSEGCGAKIAYETAKPSSCPKCRKAILDPFKVVAKATAAAVKVAVRLEPTTYEVDANEEEKIEDVPVIMPARSARSKSTASIRKPAPSRRAAQATQSLEDDLDDDSDGEYDDDGEPYSARKAKELKRQLIASVGSFAIKTQDDDGKPVTFRDWVGTGQS